MPRCSGLMARCTGIKNRAMKINYDSAVDQSGKHKPKSSKHFMHPSHLRRRAARPLGLGGGMARIVPFVNQCCNENASNRNGSLSASVCICSISDVSYPRFSGKCSLYTCDSLLVPLSYFCSPPILFVCEDHSLLTKDGTSSYTTNEGSWEVCREEEACCPQTFD